MRYVLRAEIECLVCAVSFLPKNRGGAGGFTKTCSKSCAQHLRCGTPKDLRHAEHNLKRRARELAVGGLGRHERAELLHKWVAARRSCAYCDALASSVDHVVPLARGGTNYLGNLAPACRACNTAKGILLLTEWRVKRAARV